MKSAGQRRSWLILALSLPALLMVLDAALGQRTPIYKPNFPKPPVYTPPNFSPPKTLVTVWTCSRCNRELGQGPVRPNISKCPGCGAQLIGTSFTSGPINNPGPDFKPGNVSPPPTIPQVAPNIPQIPQAPTAPDATSMPPPNTPRPAVAASAPASKGNIALIVLFSLMTGLGFLLFTGSMVLLFVRSR